MAYIPKSQIKTNLFTEGGEYLLSSNNSPYKGYYYKTSQGKFYTGRTPEDGLNVLLNPIYPEDTFSEEENYSFSEAINRDNKVFINTSAIYLSLKGIDSLTIRNIPQNIFPTPQPQDYINESFVRYFAKKRNEKKYLEINKETYDKLLSQDSTYLFELYRPLKLNWQISGDKAQSYQTNETQTSLLARRERLEGFIEYFKGNFNQLYALYTQGNTYVIANNGKPYTGFYHIMPNGQVMTGKNHTNKGINLVLREDYVEQEKPSLTPLQTSSIDAPTLSLDSSSEPFKLTGFSNLSTQGTAQTYDS